ncbi:MAG: phosphoenolpyruvate--protein phosphotransferase [Thermoguttaceae bacterium]|nr:phosphoenolpyruvate--protein phosphotransferase [Thermoguttaceae bacterium]
MKTYRGISVSNGAAIGEVLILDNSGCRLSRRFIDPHEVDSEIDRLKSAIQATSDQIAQDRDSVTREIGEEYGHIFGAHLSILTDKKLLRDLEEPIRQHNYSAEYAVTEVFDRQADMLRRVAGTLYSERANDVVDIKVRLLRQLMGVHQNSLAHLDRPVILLAASLTPSETSNLDRDNVLGFATEEGARGSHTAIVASALQIPAVLGIGRFLADVQEGDRVILDGDKGLLILNPDAETTRKYQQIIDRQKSVSQRLFSRSSAPAITQDGTEIQVFGNIEYHYESRICDINGAAGIGLYRTEFLYLGADLASLPTEEDHFQAYRTVIEAMGPNRVTTIRTFDLGADKLPSGLTTEIVEANPFMGVRSIRLSLKYQDMFRKQLRAILRASAFGPIRIMFPLVSTILEFRNAKSIFLDVCEELDEAGVPFDHSIPIGMMLEVPASIIMIHTFVKEVDFFSIGTNDLTQYSLAVDRGNKGVDFLYNSEDPAILQLVHRAIQVATMYDKPISICGQISSDPNNTMLLIGLGLRHFSVAPGVIPVIKDLCRNVTVKECEEVAKKALFMETARDIRNYLRLETDKKLGTGWTAEE